MMNVRYGIVLHCRCAMALSFTLFPGWHRVLTCRVTRSSMVGADVCPERKEDLMQEVLDAVLCGR